MAIIQGTTGNVILTGDTCYLDKTTLYARQYFNNASLTDRFGNNYAGAGTITQK